MLDQFTLMSRRWAIKNVVVTVPLDPKSDDEVVQVYARAITPRTKLLLVSHQINITGHVLPVRQICDLAHAHGVPVVVDGAHAFAQLDLRIPDLSCDYYGASLHKWLGAPLGAGLLCVRKDRIAPLWPLFGDLGVPNDDIRKLNHTGTHPAHTDLAILDAIEFHEQIGIQRKEARLRWLQPYRTTWTTRLRGRRNLDFHTHLAVPGSSGPASADSFGANGWAAVSSASLVEVPAVEHPGRTAGVRGGIWRSLNRTSLCRRVLQRSPFHPVGTHPELSGSI